MPIEGRADASPESMMLLELALYMKKRNTDSTTVLLSEVLAASCLPNHDGSREVEESDDFELSIGIAMMILISIVESNEDVDRRFISSCPTKTQFRNLTSVINTSTC